MNLEAAITIGGKEWRETYPIICKAAIKILTDEGITKRYPYSSREIQDSIMDLTNLPNKASYRQVLYKALASNATETRYLADCYHRVSQPDPVRPGKTRLAYQWHMATPPTKEEKQAVIQAKIDALQVDLDKVE